MPARFASRKKSDPWITMIVSLVLFVLFFVFQINLSSNQGCKRVETCRYEPRGPSSKTMGPQELQGIPPGRTPMESEIYCDRSHRRYDICSINGPTVLDPTASTFYVVGPANSTTSVQKVQPYPRKWESSIMGRIKEITLTSGPPSPPCSVQHNAPALVFSAAGYTGNFFHDFNDGFIPLFITVNSIFPDQDVFLVISEPRNWWVHKYADLLHSFTNHPIINLDNDTATHCFPSATLGLMSHGFMTIDPKLTPNSTTMLHFHALLDQTYGQPQTHPTISIPPKARPRLVFATRRGGIGRVILNEAEVVTMAREEGFDVTVFEPKVGTSLRQMYALIHSSHAMVGVHGAALTHLLLLRPGSVFVQVVPLGLEWVAKVCFGKAAGDMGLQYMEYRINVEESSLVEKYGKDDMVIKDPMGLQKMGWSSEIMDIYLKKQNVRLDMVRFRGYLKKAYEMARIFMDKEG